MYRKQLDSYSANYKIYYDIKSLQLIVNNSLVQRGCVMINAGCIFSIDVTDNVEV